MTNLQALKALVIKNAAFFGEAISDATVAMHAEALADLDLVSVAKAYRELARVSKIRRMPMPGEVRAIVKPVGADAAVDDARDAASRIFSAISRYGHVNPDRARKYIGELGWAVVERQGSWETVCQTVTNDNAASLQAQWRELASVLRRKWDRGDLEPPRLGAREERKVLEAK